MKAFRKVVSLFLVVLMLLPMIVACKDGKDGTVVSIGENGNWFLDGIDTGISAIGAVGATGAKGDQGEKGDTGAQGGTGANGADGITPHIGENGNWFIGTTDTGIKAEGQDGDKGADAVAPTVEIKDGYWHINGEPTGVKAEGKDGDKGADAVAPTVEIKDGYWYINGEPTGVKAEGKDGDKGADGEPGTPGTVMTIVNGYWYLDGQPTGVRAEGQNGTAGTVVSIIDGIWHLDGVSTGVSATGSNGKDGTVITIGSNGNWYLDGKDSGVSATAENMPRYTYQHVVIIGVDGGGAWFDDADMPNVDRIFANGATTDTCLASAPTISAQCWASLLTGVAPTDHGMDNTKAKENAAYTSATYPTIFNMVQSFDPRADLAVFGTWIGIQGLTEGIGVHREFFENGTKAERDRLTTNAAAAYLRSNTPTLTFVQLDSVDGAGETYGFGGAEHLAALANVDAMIGDIYNAVANAGMLEDTLFIVTADHGGTGTTHGGASADEYNVFCGFAGASILNNHALSMYQRDIPAAVCWALGIAGNEKNWNSFIPAKLFGDNKAPTARNVQSFVPRPSDTTPDDLGDFVDLSTLKAGLFFDGDLTELGSNTVTAVGTPTYEQGYHGSAVRVSKDNYVSYSDLKFGSDSFTISLWVKPDKANGNDVSIYSNKNWSSGYGAGFNIGWNNSSVLWFNAGGSGRMDNKAGLEANHGFDWIHTLLVVDREQNTVSVYGNYTLIKTVAIPATLQTLAFDSDLPFNLGADGNGSYGFCGLLDDFLVFDGAMNAQEIASLFAYYESHGEPVEKTLGIPAAMASYLNLNKLRAGLTFDSYTVTDAVGDHDATVKGTATFVEGYNGAGYQTSVGNYISYEDLKFGADSFAIAMWVKPDATNTKDMVIFGNKGWSNGRTDGFLMEFAGTQLYFNNGRGNQDANRTNLKYAIPNYTGEWVHIMLLVERSATVDTVTLYVNFEKVATTTLKAGVLNYTLDGAGAFSIGDDDGATSDTTKQYTFCGSFDDVLIFNDTLTDAEIAALAAYYAQ